MNAGEHEEDVDDCHLDTIEEAAGDAEPACDEADEAGEVLRLRADIGWAVKAMREGALVQRAGWNGKGMHVGIHTPNAHDKMDEPFVFMFTAQARHIPWLASQADLLAVDWQIAD